MMCYALSSARHGLSAQGAASFAAKAAKGVVMKSKTLATVIAVFVAGPVLALEPIEKEKHINDTLRQGFIADKIADECPTLGPRKLRALWELYDLRSYALDKGYSEDVLKAFVENKAEKKRGRREAAEWLEKAGAVSGQPETYCAVGQAEIAKDSLIGQLLKDE